MKFLGNIIMRFPLFIGICCLFSMSAIAAKDFPGIEKLMTEEEFAQSGLARQTPEELAALNAWLIKYTAHDAEAVRNSTKQVKKESKKSIHSSIDGQFNGWSGKTIFRLKNGQVWKQRLDGHWRTNLQSPKVTIKRNFFGFYEMRLDDSTRKIGVKRIE